MYPLHLLTHQGDGHDDGLLDYLPELLLSVILGVEFRSLREVGKDALQSDPWSSDGSDQYS